jgi:hypothetical protein
VALPPLLSGWTLVTSTAFLIEFLSARAGVALGDDRSAVVCDRRAGRRPPLAAD